MYPILYSFESFDISSTAAVSVLGFLLSVFLIARLARRSKLGLDFFTDHLFVFFLGALLGARLIFILENLSLFSEDIWSALRFWEGGLNLSGGILGILVTLFYYCRQRGEKFLKWLDVFVIAGFAGLSLGDLGCFLGGCNYGKPTALPWGITLENIDIPYTVPLHPTQIYSALFTLSATVLLYRWWRKKPGKGKTGLAGILYGSLFYFLNGFLLGDQTSLFFGDFLRLDQVIYLIFFFLAAGLLLQYQKINPEAEAWKDRGSLN